VVPEGSTATKRLINETNALIKGWYDDKVVFYFSFDEKKYFGFLRQGSPFPIYVAFNINPSSDPNSVPLLDLRLNQERIKHTMFWLPFHPTLTTRHYGL